MTSSNADTSQARSWSLMTGGGSSLMQHDARVLQERGPPDHAMRHERVVRPTRTTSSRTPARGGRSCCGPSATSPGDCSACSFTKRFCDRMMASQPVPFRPQSGACRATCPSSRSLSNNRARSCAVLAPGRRHVDVADAGESLLDDMTDDQLIELLMLRRGAAQPKPS